jgi:riboflavin kinase / FMN adenylyltransferase
MKFFGQVVKGKGMGRELGFPTINLNVNEKIEDGVYVCKVEIDAEVFNGAMFCKGNCVEIHLLDFDDDVYGKQVKVFMGRRIRDVEKFTEDEELSKQIEKDVELVAKISS